MSEIQPNLQKTLKLNPGTLWTRTIQQTEHAIKCGALLSIPTEYELVEQDGISFIIRILANLKRKDEAKKQEDKKTAKSGKEFNPFLPYDPDLFVTDISNTHLCLLNKFNIINHHLLIVTRAFEEQENLLTVADFEAMWICLSEIDGLAFYNGGKMAGASQRHKHLQLVPLPLVPDGSKIPIESAIASANFQDGIGKISEFPFNHAIAKLNPISIQSPSDAAQATLACYDNLLRAVGLAGKEPLQAGGAYNLLATREWMMIVPRLQEDFQSIPVNSLGFAGAMLVRNEAQMKLLKDLGPMSILTNVARRL
jgi:ATP adenylyltransferase